MKFPRSSGILLHPTSLPNQFGIGDLGREAYKFIDFLVETGQKLWQILPLSPTSYGNSPYTSFSAFAGNHLLISPEELLNQGLLFSSDLSNLPLFPEDEVDYEKVIEFKNSLFQRSFEHFKKNTSWEKREALETFCQQNSSWLPDYALFMALKDDYQGTSWNKWDKKITKRSLEAIKEASEKLIDSILFHKYLQWQFFRQWSFLKEYANNRNIKIIGDLPIFLDHNSADVWTHPEMFFLDKKGNPLVVAGVPPDYFSNTGQRWGNPLYRWKTAAQRKYDWWIARFKAMLQVVDIVRIDHFRGFEAYWEIKATEETAINGRWVKGPRAKLFKALEKALGKLPIIAEDLGVITEEVKRLRDQFEFPGMKIFQFAFGSGADNLYLPHNFSTKDCVVYTGTHDNDTIIGWLTKTATLNERNHALRYLGRESETQIHWDFIQLALSSIANMAIIPLQDVLGLGNQARMNLPGKALGNWKWRYTSQMLNNGSRERLKELTERYGR
ncbi:4-alpha-glucanotransferase [bacterium]|nr:4-alpha-glucanotransferase [bacterium]MBU0899548.1 4-alpha-glucanotransferase [bacterium]MBU1152904.1 4-alpha-glucanotransferase [bacterium]MBU1782756.1 4-alpha-glucanotransferase [bacterium]MBU2599562.1 4-alpha-glucanotransferase [bacterium]